MNDYVIMLERKHRNRKYKYFIFECQADTFYKALEIANIKMEKLKAQIDIDYEIKKIEKI
jgi:hypothetical protein